ncbi:hypothetical protein [Nonomuraea sp. NPDC023979]|uniref:hypothetical protein n=1 Tax=Nonomuraea sp. NPDC023979 TaxID=3154796 RepID=UPI0033E706AC
MGLDLSLVPDVVKPLAKPLTGGAFPGADVGGLLAEAQALERLADLLAGIKAEDAGAVTRLLRSGEWEGVAKEAFEKAFESLGGEAGSVSGEAVLDVLERALRDEAEALRTHGVRMQHAEWMIYAALALLGVMIVRLLVWIYVNGPAVLALIRHHTLMTQVSIQTIKRLMLLNTLKFAGIMGGLDLGVQVAQQLWGDREAGDFDLASLAMSTGSGALTGVLFGGANAALSRLLSKQMVYVASRAELAVRDKIVAIGQSMYGQALLGGAAGTAGAVPALAASGQLDASHLGYAFISGVAGGLDVPASARVSYLPMAAIGEIGGPAHPAGDSPPPARPALGETSLAGAAHADTAPPPAPRAPDDAGPQVLPNGALAGEVVRRHDTPLPPADRAAPTRPPHQPPGDRAPQPHPGDRTPHTRPAERAPQDRPAERAPQDLPGERARNLPAERAPQSLPAERTPYSQSAATTARADAAGPGELPRASLVPATIPATVVASPETATGGEPGPERPEHPRADAPPPARDQNPPPPAPRPEPAAPATPRDQPEAAAPGPEAGALATTRDRPEGAASQRERPVASMLAADHAPTPATPVREGAPPAAGGTAVQDRAYPAGAQHGPDVHSPIADPRPRNFAEAAAIVHRWTPGPQNRIERLLSGPSDEVLLAEGRQLAERLSTTRRDDATARALAHMSRSLGGPDPARAVQDLARDVGLDREIDALVDVFGDAQRYEMAPEAATDRASLTAVLDRMMGADSYRWTGFRNQLRFSFHDADADQARTIGIMIDVMGEPVTSSRVRSYTKPVLDRYGIRDIRELLPVFRAAHQNGHFPRGAMGEADFLAAMDAFRREDPALWDGVLLAERHALTGLSEPEARLLALLDDLAARQEGDTPPLERLAAEVGQGDSVEQLLHLAADAHRHGADLTRVSGPRELADLLTAHRTRDPYLWDGLRVAAEHGVTRPADDAARALSRLAEITGSEAPSRLPVFEPLRRLAVDAGLGYSVERLADRAAEVQQRGFDLFAPVGRQQVLDALIGDAGAAAPRPPAVPPGLHDLPPSAHRDALRAASRELDAAQQTRPEQNPVLRRVRSLLAGPDPLAAMERERVASLESRVRAWQRWPDRPEVSYTRDFAAFRDAYDRAVERAVSGEPVIPYMLDDATASLGAREGGRGFGLELEFELPEGVSSRRLEDIARALHQAGLTGDAVQHGYHTMKKRGYSAGANGGLGLWALEQDGTVAGELVSPILYDEPATWANLRTAVEIIRAHGGTAGPRTGGHVHVSTHDFDHIVENYVSTLVHVGHHTDTLFRLAHNPEADSHRGLKHCRPNAVPTEGYAEIGPVRHGNSGHDSAVNMQAMTGSAADHIELRLWDGSLDAAVIQAQVKVSLGLVEAAFRNATLDHLPNRGEPDPLGAHAGHFRDPAQDRTEAGSLSFRSLMDEIFWRAADKEQLTALYAATRWATEGTP